MNNNLARRLLASGYEFGVEVLDAIRESMSDERHDRIAREELNIPQNAVHGGYVSYATGNNGAGYSNVASGYSYSHSGYMIRHKKAEPISSINWKQEGF